MDPKIDYSSYQIDEEFLERQKRAIKDVRINLPAKKR